MPDKVNWELLFEKNIGPEEKTESSFVGKQIEKIKKEHKGIFPNNAPVLERMIEQILQIKGIAPKLLPLNIIELQLRMQENNLKPSKKELFT